MQKVENECVGCEYCINCGRKHVSHYVCDGHNCEADTIDGETKLYEDGDRHYCLRCLIEIYKDDFMDEMIAEHGEEWALMNFEEVEDD